MVNLDSTKLLVKTDVINGISGAFLHKQVQQNNRVFTDVSQITNTGILGLKSIMVDNLHHEATVEFSAKILGADYPKGVNINTIGQAIETINKSGLIDLNVPKFIDTAQVLRCDVTDNIQPELMGESFYKTLAALPIASKYHTTLYNKKTNLGVTWNGQQKTVRDRIIFYDKIKQITTDKLLMQKPYAQKVYNEFKNVVRVESNHSQFKALRNYFGDRNLLTVLKSPVRVNYNVFNRITDKTTDVDLRLFNQFEGMRFSAIRNRLGDEGIINLCGNDWQKIELFIKVYNTNNYRHYKKTIRAVYNELNTRTGQADLNIINHIKQLLYAA
jgi:hypothetical protein